MVRQLQPWYENIGKRQVKAPKIYLRDSETLHSLLNIPDLHTLLGHPCLGASREGFALEQTLQIVNPPQAFTWATHGGAELDLFLPLRGKRFGIEPRPPLARLSWPAQLSHGCKDIRMAVEGDP